MPIRYVKFVTRAMLRAKPETLWLFGDNLMRRGLGGQAKEMRGEPNAVGIPTKREPHNGEGAFFDNSPANWIAFVNASTPDIARLRNHLTAGGTVVFPEDGIGTGLADLERRAPRIWAALQDELDELKAIAGEG